MNIDNEDFIKFNQEIFFYNYKINYIDKATTDSMKNKSANIVYKTNCFKCDYKQYKNYKEMLAEIIKAIESDKAHKIARVFCRIGKAILCLIRYD